MRNGKSVLRDGDQFVLDLFPGVPWAGRSPRALTRVGSGLFLRRKPPGHEVEVDPRQLSLWQASVGAIREKSTGAERGAPPLLPLRPRRRRGAQREVDPFREV